MESQNNPRPMYETAPEIGRASYEFPGVHIGYSQKNNNWPIKAEGKVVGHIFFDFTAGTQVLQFHEVVSPYVFTQSNEVYKHIKQRYHD